MKLPFTVEQFIDVFTRYNAIIGHAPILAYTLAIAMLVVAARRLPWANLFIGIGLAAMWAWTGIMYHAVFFSPINPAALLFAGAFVLQSALLATAAFRGQLDFRLTIRGVRGRMGHLMVVFSMLIYPVLGMISGHGYPNGPVFGLTPCPLVIFTFGMLLFTEPNLPKYLVTIPLLWALIGSTAAMGLGIREDTGLLICGIIATTVLLLRRKKAKATTPRAVAFRTHRLAPPRRPRTRSRHADPLTNPQPMLSCPHSGGSRTGMMEPCHLAPGPADCGDPTRVDCCVRLRLPAFWSPTRASSLSAP